MALTLTASFITVLLIVGCKGGRFDYRHKYTGNFTVTGSRIESGWSSDTLNIQDTCEVTMLDSDDEMNFHLNGQGIELEFVVTKDGDLRLTGSGLPGGQVEKESFRIAFAISDPFGSTTTWDLDGVRLEE